MISSKGGIKKMSNLQQATVKSMLDILHSTNIKIESFVIMAISMESPLKLLFGTIAGFYESDNGNCTGAVEADGNPACRQFSDKPPARMDTEKIKKDV